MLYDWLSDKNTPTILRQITNDWLSDKNTPTILRQITNDWLIDFLKDTSIILSQVTLGLWFHFSERHVDSNITQFFSLWQGMIPICVCRIVHH